MKWLELQVVADRDTADDIAALLSRFSYGSAVVEESFGSAASPDGCLTVKAYLPADRSLPAKRKKLAEAIGHLSLICPLELQERTLSEEDWALAWRAFFATHRVGQRLVIKPSWQNYQAREGEIVLQLDPGMAFGTGLHPTTRMCLEALERYLKPGMLVLDLGTGSGIQALAAARLGAARVLAVDTDSIAVRAAKSNVRANGLAQVIRVRQGTIPFRESRAAFDLVVANITAQVIEKLAGSLAASLKSGGWLIAGGIVAERLEGVLEALTRAGTDAQQVSNEGEWRTVVALKRP